MEKLQKILEQTIKNSGEEVSILIKELNKNEYIYNYNTKIKMISASKGVKNIFKKSNRIKYI